jgi:hypothetical protein
VPSIEPLDPRTLPKRTETYGSRDSSAAAAVIRSHKRFEKPSTPSGLAALSVLMFTKRLTPTA